MEDFRWIDALPNAPNENISGHQKLTGQHVAYSFKLAAATRTVWSGCFKYGVSKFMRNCESLPTLGHGCGINDLESVAIRPEFTRDWQPGDRLNLFHIKAFSELRKVSRRIS